APRPVVFESSWLTTWYVVPLTVTERKPSCTELPLIPRPCRVSIRTNSTGEPLGSRVAPSEPTTSVATSAEYVFPSLLLLVITSFVRTSSFVPVGISFGAPFTRMLLGRDGAGGVEATGVRFDEQLASAKLSASTALI